MNVFYYYYFYQHDGKQKQEMFLSFDEMFGAPYDLQPVLTALNGIELDVDQKVQEKVMAYARQL